MIRRIQDGTYEIIHADKITFLKLDHKNTYEWREDVLICRGNLEVTGNQEASATYRLYDVHHEADLTDGAHLELHQEKGTWIGYILPSGIPQKAGVAKIHPTKERITVPTIIE